jgi:hypothetical protein
MLTILSVAGGSVAIFLIHIELTLVERGQHEFEGRPFSRPSTRYFIRHSRAPFGFTNKYVPPPFTQLAVANRRIGQRRHSGVPLRAL